MDTTNDQSFEPARESDAPDNDHIETNRMETAESFAEPTSTNTLASSTSSRPVFARDVVATTTQPAEAAFTSPASRRLPLTRTREIITTSGTTSAPVVQSPLVSEERDVSESSSKRQKLELETTLERFLADQKERQQEQREHKRTRLSEQQDLQRQTIDLQKRALDIQEKAMNMQERLMALMEKVMDKLN
ncbi:hypothetical protein Pcac1_g7567 [Phytophthora cactorum]|nr:hypothetical protein Pcac1_g7567 [Phytophthora cactorum]RAW30163.1 hypothetical protein PC110_g13462 [Phytophthora cactorum]